MRLHKEGVLRQLEYSIPVHLPGSIAGAVSVLRRASQAGRDAESESEPEVTFEVYA